jgi:hypothetical protein
MKGQVIISTFDFLKDFCSKSITMFQSVEDLAHTEIKDRFELFEKFEEFERFSVSSVILCGIRRPPRSSAPPQSPASLGHDRRE